MDGCRKYRLEARETIEVGGTPKAILDTAFSIGRLLQTLEGSRVALRGEADILLLYQSENDEVFSVTRRMIATGAAEAATGPMQRLSASVGEFYAIPSGDGIEVRFTLEYTFASLGETTLALVDSCSMEESCEAAGTLRPSVILKPYGDAGLWELAKRCRATVDDILAANELPDESSIPSGAVLLIPQRRC